MSLEAGAGPTQVEIDSLESLAEGDTLTLPVEFHLDQLNLRRQLAWKSIKDSVSGASCTMALSKAQAPVTLQKAYEWRVTKVIPLHPTAIDCREGAHRLLKSSYERAQAVIDEDWMTDNPANRSLYKRRASEIYLKNLDRLNASKNACVDVLSQKQAEDIQGSSWVIMENPKIPGRQLSIWCDRRGVSLDAVKEAGIEVWKKDQMWAKPAGVVTPVVKTSVNAFK